MLYCVNTCDDGFTVITDSVSVLMFFVLYLPTLTWNNTTTSPMVKDMLEWLRHKVTSISVVVVSVMIMRFMSISPCFVCKRITLPSDLTMPYVLMTVPKSMVWIMLAIDVNESGLLSLCDDGDDDDDWFNEGKRSISCGFVVSVTVVSSLRINLY